MKGKMSRARIWITATPDTSTPVLDINFALADKGATSFTATNGGTVTIHTTDIDDPAVIRATTDGVLVNDPTFSTDTPLSNKWDVYSVLFDGVDEYVDAGTALGDALGDNYAGSLTVSLWFKADVTSGDDGLFDFGPFGGSNGVFSMSVRANLLRNNLNHSAWKRTVAFTDTANWHHVVCVYAAGSEANSKMYLDGVSVGTTVGTFPSAEDMDFAGLQNTIGGYDRDIYVFNGNIDEVAVWDSALSAAQITAIYNGGTPQSLAPYSPTSWWRMGDGDYYPTLKDSSGNDYDGTMTNMESSDIRTDTP